MIQNGCLTIPYNGRGTDGKMKSFFTSKNELEKPKIVISYPPDLTCLLRPVCYNHNVSK